MTKINADLAVMQASDMHRRSEFRQSVSSPALPARPRWLKRMTHVFLGAAAAALATSTMATIRFGAPQSRSQIDIDVGLKLIDGQNDSWRLLGTSVTNLDRGAPADAWVTPELPDPGHLTIGLYPGAPFHLGEEPVGAGNGAIPAAIACSYFRPTQYHSHLMDVRGHHTQIRCALLLHHHIHAI